MAKEKQIKELKDIICGWEQVCRDETDKFISALEVSEWEKWHKEFIEDERRHKEDGHNFNVFSLLKDEFGFHVKETMHSKLLKFLLDTNSSHGQGKKFLIEFLKLLEIEKAEDGKWNVTADKGKIDGKVDVLLKRNEPTSVIIIENKPYLAEDQPNQLYRYWYYEIYCRTERADKEYYLDNKDKYRIVYLTPHKEECEEQSLSKPADWRNPYLPKKLPMDIDQLCFDVDIQEWLENCKKVLPETNHRIREYITQFQMLCKTL